MKTFAIIVLLALNLSGYCQAVKHDLNGIPKKANKISILNSKTAEENYIQAGKILVQNGYGLKTSNKEFGQFETTPKPMKRSKVWTAMFNIVVADSLIIVTGQFNTGISIGFGSGVRNEASYNEIKNMGRSGIYDNSAFYEMIDLALKFGDNLKYTN